jgi:quercetin dioxygenase-like cupin family protein
MTKHPEYLLAGVVMKQHLSSKETAGSFSLFENRSGGNSKTPIHVHTRDDETVFMIEGSMQAIIAGRAQTIDAGNSVFLPRGVPHQLMNVSGRPAHYLLLCTPGGFEGFLEQGSHLLAPGETSQPPSPADVDRIKAAALHFGIELLTAWPDEKLQ